MLLNTADTQAARHELERAATLYRALGGGPHLGSTLAALGFALPLLGRLADAEEAIREAIDLLEPAGWLRTLATAYNAQLVIEAFRGRFDEARAAQKKAEHLCEMTGADRMALTVAANLVQLSLEQGDFDGAISAGRNLTVRLRDTRHSYLLGLVLGVLAGAFTMAGNLDEALTAARKPRRFFVMKAGCSGCSIISPCAPHSTAGRGMPHSSPVTPTRFTRSSGTRASLWGAAPWNVWRCSCATRSGTKRLPNSVDFGVQLSETQATSIALSS